MACVGLGQDSFECLSDAPNSFWQMFKDASANLACN